MENGLKLTASPAAAAVSVEAAAALAAEALDIC